MFALLVACGENTIGNGDVDANGGGDVDANGGQIDANFIDAMPPPENAAVYAHTSSSLYLVDPNTLEVTLIGDFGWPNGSDSMTDIAIDQFGRMIGVSFNSVYEVDEETGNCIYLAPLQGAGFNGLSFIESPAGGLEVLVGADLSGNIYELDPATGATTLVGNYGGGYVSSGDIVSVRGAGTFATVTDNVGTDQLAFIDPADNYAATIIGDTGYDNIWGLGYWRNKVYGFSSDNQFLTIDVGTGEATPEQAGAFSWWGAGVTTLAPIIE